MVMLGGYNEGLLLTCQAIGVSSYCWERQLSDIPAGSTGVNTDTLTLVNPEPNDTGNYRCLVGNHSDERFSDYARITVNGQ